MGTWSLPFCLNLCPIFLRERLWRVLRERMAEAYLAWVSAAPSPSPPEWAVERRLCTRLQLAQRRLALALSQLSSVAGGTAFGGTAGSGTLTATAAAPACAAHGIAALASDVVELVGGALNTVSCATPPLRFTKA